MQSISGFDNTLNGYDAQWGEYIVNHANNSFSPEPVGVNEWNLHLCAQKVVRLILRARNGEPEATIFVRYLRERYHYKGLEKW